MWWAGLWEDEMCCGSETFFECGEDRHTGRGGDDGIPDMQAGGALHCIEGGEAVWSPMMVPIVCPSGRRSVYE
jgi:hypothetical protein